jgi:hypothetical protein
MRRFKFRGLILPDIPQLTFDVPELSDRLDRMTISAQVLNSSVSVTVTAQDQIDLLTARNSAAYFLRGIVDATMFVSAQGRTLELTAGAEEGKPEIVFDAQFIGLDHIQAQASAEDLVHLALTDAPFRRALEEFRAAITDPLDSSFHAFRAIDALRQSFKLPSDGDDAKKSWNRMGQALHFGRSYTEALEPSAVAQRHGETLEATEEGRRDALLTARRLVARYADWRISGALNLATNPQLM